MQPQIVAQVPLVAHLVPRSGALQRHSKKKETIGIELCHWVLDNTDLECFSRAQDFYIYGTTLALSLTTNLSIEAPFYNHLLNKNTDKW